MMAAAGLLAASCSDFDDYNEAYSSGSEESTLSVWENIASRSDLSEFADLLEKSGYDEILQDPTFVTVFAPENGSFDYDSLSTVDSTLLTERFVMNHIANYNYNASSTSEVTRVYTLNEKSFNMEYDSGWKFDGLDMIETNLPSVNGLMHIIDGYAEFRPNIYEYIFDSTSDSLAAYFDYFESNTFDESQSVAGSIDSLGRQTYSDSVFVEENTLTRLLNADLSEEDSLYTLLIPTNEAYASAYEKIKTYYAYPEEGEIEYDPLSSDGVGSTLTVDVESDYLTDSLARLNLAYNLIFSHYDWYNGWVDEVIDEEVGEEIWQEDTIRTTSGVKLSNGPEILSYTVGSPVELSNGYARMIDTLAVRPWDSWCPELEVDLSLSENYPLYNSCSVTRVTVQENEWNDTIGDYISSYLRVDSINDSSRPEVYFYLDGVKSTTYNVYLVFLPWNITKGTSHPEKLIQFDVELSYCDEDGVTSESNTSILTDSANMGKVDTIQVLTVTFPYCYAALDDEDAAPYLRVRINRNKYNSTQKNYGNTMRIAGIILRPVEYDEYLTSEETDEEEGE